MNMAQLEINILVRYIFANVYVQVNSLVDLRANTGKMNSM